MRLVQEAKGSSLVCFSSPERILTLILSRLPRPLLYPSKSIDTRSHRLDEVRRVSFWSTAVYWRRATSADPSSLLPPRLLLRFTSCSPDKAPCKRCRTAGVECTFEAPPAAAPRARGGGASEAYVEA